MNVSGALILALLLADALAFVLLVSLALIFLAEKLPSDIAWKPSYRLSERLEAIATWTFLFLFCQLAILPILAVVYRAMRHGWDLDTAISIVFLALLPILLLLGATGLLLLFKADGKITDILFECLQMVGRFFQPLVALLIILIVVEFVVHIAGLGAKFVIDVGTPLNEKGTLPFYITGLVGFVLLAISLRTKHAIVGALGAALVATAFSHWVGPITFPK